MRCPFQMREVSSMYSRNPPTFTTSTVHVECCREGCQAWDRTQRECRLILNAKTPVLGEE